jgi:D-tyrosyl-tRNA(Tyr) deacylase
MRVLVQRVLRAEVRVRGHEPARIGPGLLLLVGLGGGDSEAELRWMASKVAHLRIFRDDSGLMNRSLVEEGGGCLAVSQFTLYGDARFGRRPSFVQAMEPDRAGPMFARFVSLLQDELGVPVATGVFGASMEVELVNDGPVTLMLERTPTVA